MARGCPRRTSRSSCPWHPTYWAARPSARGDQLRAVLPPPLFAGLGEGGDGIVVGVPAAQGFGVVVFDPRPVVLRPVRDALLPVVALELVDPTLAHERNVAHDARRGEPGKVS